MEGGGENRRQIPKPCPLEEKFRIDRAGDRQFPKRRSGSRSYGDFTASGTVKSPILLFSARFGEFASCRRPARRGGGRRGDGAEAGGGDGAEAGEAVEPAVGKGEEAEAGGGDGAEAGGGDGAEAGEAVEPAVGKGEGPWVVAGASRQALSPDE
jgi:hypothetical protein